MTETNGLSENTRATLLLCGKLGDLKSSLSPLTDAQYNLVAKALFDLGRRPSDLVGADETLVRTVCDAANALRTGRVTPLDADHVNALLRRGFALASALEKWQAMGIRVVGRGDGAYPKRFRQHLRPAELPPLLYCAGRVDLFTRGGMAFVGSRDITDEASAALRVVAADCVAAGMSVISGGARGADQTAMQTAFDTGGNVIGALTGDLIKSCLIPENRAALAAGRALLFSNVDPAVGFSKINAMVRNKYIYALADAAFVAQSDTKGGTWQGATEELKRETRNPVFVHAPDPLPEGNKKLIALGALAWDPKASFQDNLARKPLQQATLGI